MYVDVWPSESRIRFLCRFGVCGPETTETEKNAEFQEIRWHFYSPPPIPLPPSPQRTLTFHLLQQLLSTIVPIVSSSALSFTHSNTLAPQASWANDVLQHGITI